MSCSSIGMNEAGSTAAAWARPAAGMMQFNLPTPHQMGCSLSSKHTIDALPVLDHTWQQQDGPLQLCQQVAMPTTNLQVRLMAADAERQRLQQELDALSISHEALTSHCAHLEQLLQARTNTSSSTSTAVPDHTLAQLKALHQQLAEASHDISRQQDINKQLDQQLQQGTLRTTQMEQRMAADAAALAAVQEELSTTQQGFQASRKEVQTLFRQLKEMSAARVKQDTLLSAAEGRAAAAEAISKTTQQQYQHLQAMKEDMKVQLSAARQQARTAAARAADQFKQDRLQLQGGMAAAAEAAATANAARRAACRDEVAVLVAMQHLTVQQLLERKEMADVKQQLEAAQEGAQQACKQVAKAQQEKDAAAAVHAELLWRAERAEHSTLIAEVDRGIVERECSSLRVRCQQLEGEVKHQMEMVVLHQQRLQQQKDHTAKDVAYLTAKVVRLKAWWEEAVAINKKYTAT
jgi:hypothetical protein